MAAGLLGHGGDGDRLPGGHHRRVFGRPPGGPAWLSAEAADRAHLGGDHRSDLCAVDQLAAAGVGAHPRLHFPVLGVPCIRVRDGGHRDDHDHHAAVLLHRPPSVAATSLAGSDRRSAASARRSAVPRRQSDEVRARGVAPVADRGDRLHRPHHMAARPGDRHPAARTRGRSFARVHRRAPRAPACRRTSSRNRRVPQSQQDHGPAGDARKRRSRSCTQRERGDPVGSKRSQSLTCHRQSAW